MSRTKPNTRSRAETAKIHGVRVGRSSAGLGLFTTIPRKKDDFIIEYTGERLTDDEANERGGKYLFTIDDDLVLDGSGREHIGRYINHSCRPNCYAEIDDDLKEVHIRAKRKITADEELTYHYGKEYFDDHIKPRGCRCTACSSDSQK